MIYKQQNLFARELYRIKKPIRLIEAFAGMGAQYKALGLFNDIVPIEHYKIIEWSVKSIEAYNAIHIKDFKDYSNDLKKEELIDKIKGISVDYNNPLTLNQLKKRPLNWLKNVYNNVIATNNLINIMSVKGSDLEIIDKDKFTYIFTYSFPCQDVSISGNRKGLSTSQADGGTRSGLLWEVERILDELKPYNTLPQVLIMENVPGLIEATFKEDFNKWENKLSNLGYSNFIKIINGIDYGIAQNRKRVFMVSILGNEYYEFPRKMEKDKKLGYFLEDNVNKKYFLSTKFLKVMIDPKRGNFGKRFKPSKKEDLEYCPTITTRTRNAPNETYILVPTKNYKNYISWEDEKGRINTQDHRAYKEVSGTIGAMTRGIPKILINNETIKKDIALIASNGDYYCIRSLTPKETNRLMGFQDIDYQSLVNIGQSDTNIYHANGDSIIVTVLIGLFGMMLTTEEDTILRIKNYIKTIKE